MTANELRAKFLEFFKSKGHSILPSASVIPENDPSVLFITAGMQPLIPYLLGESHPAGKRLANVQKCVRTGDIDEVGDNRHLTFFEMLGNWSLGDYFKNESIRWSWEFLTDAKWLGLPSEKIFVTVFAGNDEAARDEESIAIWKSIFESVNIEPKIDTDLAHGGRIFSYPARGYLEYPENKNWWQPGPVGPQGPDTEIFFDTGKEHDLKYGAECHPNCDCGRFVEIWNNVFMQFARHESGCPLIELKQKNVDTGMGIERLAALMEECETPFETSLFRPIISKIESAAGISYANSGESIKSMRIIADHIRAVVFIIGDEHGIEPSNVDQGYIVRRLIRRAVRYGYQLGVKNAFLTIVARAVVETYSAVYPELADAQERILRAIFLEEEKFMKTIEKGVREVEILRRELSQFGGALDRLAGGAPDDTDARALLERATKSAWMNDPGAVHKILSEKDSWALPVLIAHLRDSFMISGDYLFSLYSTHGMPFELVKEFSTIDENGRPIAYALPLRFDETGFKQRFEKHQEMSRKGAFQKFSGGLADSSWNSVRLHTATHLLHESLRRILGNHVFQRGSNITPERLRFDFSHSVKMTEDELARVERMVNEQIKHDMQVNFEMLSVAEAKKLGAIGLFEEKYSSLGDQVKMYTVGDKNNIFSREICGGPHVEHTGQIGYFKILKEEGVSAGIRRIKAIVE